MTKGSKFAGLRSMRAQREQQLETGAGEQLLVGETRGAQAAQQGPLASPSEQAGGTPQPSVVLTTLGTPDQTSATGETRRRPGRPRGKRSNPDYHPITILVHGSTYLEVKRKLIGRDEDVSDVINALLRQWISER